MDRRSFTSLLDGGSGSAASAKGQTIGTLLASIATAALGFGVQFALFYALQFKYKEIYRPATRRDQRVDEWTRREDARKERLSPDAHSLGSDLAADNAALTASSSDHTIKPPYVSLDDHTAQTTTSSGRRSPVKRLVHHTTDLRNTLKNSSVWAVYDSRDFLQWVKPIFYEHNDNIIQNAGLDAYFFLRYLRMLLRIFTPMAILILPVLMPLNRYGGGTASGVDSLSWSNIAPRNISWTWAHLVLAVLSIIWVCFVSYDELRNFIAIRQLYLTSPAHRVKASARTILVRGIPQDWLSEEALTILFDVYPDAIHKIWINRNYDALNDLVNLRTNLAKSLEAAETDLIKKCLASPKAKDVGVVSKALNSQPPRGLDLGRPSTNLIMPLNPESKPNIAGSPSQLRVQPASSPKSAPRFFKNVLKAIFGVVGLYGREYYDTRQSYYADFGQALLPKDVRLPTKKKPEQGPGLVEKLCFWRSLHSDEDKSRQFLSAKVERQKDDLDYQRDLECLADTEKRDMEGVSDSVNSKSQSRWLDYIDRDARETLKEPFLGMSWLPGLPTFDKIYHLRRELSRLNKEIEEAQADPSNDEKFPKMNSAFIQFKMQIAAHMACQSLSHHAPESMAPRLVEISPHDVLWGNMSIRWWDHYLRTAVVFAISIGLVILYAIPVTVTGVLSKANKLIPTTSWLHWLIGAPGVVITVIQGVLPPVILSLILLLVPVIFRVLVRLQGVATRSDRELGVQQYYFVFLFIQVFLVATLSSGLTSFLADLAADPGRVVTQFSYGLPNASDYFFSYMIVNALGNSASALLQSGTLFNFFILAPMVDSTPRAKWRRKIPSQNVQWGSYFPPFTNFAVIGLVFSIIAPFILIFNLITFALFWIVQRYNIIYVIDFKTDTGGMLFPVAINQLFTGLYVLEICLAGLFFLARDAQNNVAAIPQAVIMIVVLFATAIFQYLLNRSFQPLIDYLPIALEDKADARDEACKARYASEFTKRHVGEKRRRDSTTAERTSSVNKEYGSQEHDDYVLPSIEGLMSDTNRHGTRIRSLSPSLGDSGRKSTSSAAVADESDLYVEPGDPAEDPLLERLYQEFETVMKDMSIQERDLQITESFNHIALRSKRPLVWLPRDPLGISDDEIKRCDGQYGNIWMSNVDVTVDGKGKIRYPDNALAPDYKPDITL